MDNTATICIVGLGLMGGSLALALRETAPASQSSMPGFSPQQSQTTGSNDFSRIVGVGRSRERLEAARVAGAIDTGTTDLSEGLASAEVIVLAMPVRAILRLLPEVGRHAQPGALVLDLGSTKAEICAAMADLPRELEPVGGHPMCGKETGGFVAAEAGLYRDRPFVLCPLPRTSTTALGQATALARAVGARPILLDPAVHDRAVAAISHLPYTVAVALVNAVAAADEPTAWSLAASGLRDTSRIAASDVDMMLDILLTNREALRCCIDAFNAQLSSLRAALDAGDEESLRQQLTSARERRAEIGRLVNW